MCFVGQSPPLWPLEPFLGPNELTCHGHDTKLASTWDNFDIKTVLTYTSEQIFSTQALLGPLWFI